MRSIPQNGNCDEREAGCLRNKVLIILVAAVLLVGMAAAPTVRLLSHFGWIEFEDLGNYIDPDRTYEGFGAEPLNAIEEGKAEIRNTYINYMPFYKSLLAKITETKDRLNRPLTDALTGWSAALRSKPQTETPGGDGGETTPPAKTETATETPPASAGTTAGREDSRTPTQERERTFGVVSDLESRFYKSSGITGYYVFKAQTENVGAVEFVDRAVTIDYDACIERADGQLKEINRLADSHPEVNFYVYLGTRLQETPDSETCFPDADNNTPVLEYYESHLSSGIHAAHFGMNSVEDRLNYYYLTDHHWTAAGMLKAYGEIIDLLRKGFSDISAPLEPVAYEVVDGVEFQGVHSREISKYDISDPFAYYDFDLPAHDQDGGTPVSLIIRKLRRGNLKLSNGNAYAEFYKYASWYSYPENKTGHNLLLLGDSFMYCEAELLASHFDETYVMHVEMKDKTVDYDEFIREHNITDVLILGYDLRLVYAHIGDIHLDRLTTGAD